MTDFNPKDAEYLSRLQAYYANWKSIPSYASLCEVFGIASKSWVKAILTRLGKAGFIERTPDGVWVPTRQFFARPLAESSVPAGMPAPIFATSGHHTAMENRDKGTFTVEKIGNALNVASWNIDEARSLGDKPGAAARAKVLAHLKRALPEACGKLEVAPLARENFLPD